MATCRLIILSILFMSLEAVASDCSRTSIGVLPLNDLGPGLYRGQPGGLYPGGANSPPPAHASAGLEAARSVRKLNADGNPDEHGRIVLLSIGMSNTAREFRAFVSLANSDPGKNPNLVFVNGAAASITAERIVDLTASTAQMYWSTLDAQLSKARVTPAQVQIAWVKQVTAAPRSEFADHTAKLKRDLALIAQILHTRFPNIRLAYYSSRIYAGYASTDLNPEPFAYESGYAVKWLIEDQINGEQDLNFDPSHGRVKAPWLGWGPYLWADGLTARSDGLTYSCSDFAADGTHPQQGARDKVVKMLLDFFKTDATARLWFLRGDDQTPSIPPAVPPRAPFP